MHATVLKKLLRFVISVIDLYSVSEYIPHTKTRSKLISTLKTCDYKKITVHNEWVYMHGHSIYDATCVLMISQLRITIKPKKKLFVPVLLLLSIWTTVLLNESGILLEIVMSVLFIIAIGYIHKQMMQLYLQEIRETVLASTP